jgi:hypothetical protein
MSTDRDTHFSGFARLLWIDIVQSPEWPTIYLSEETVEQVKQIIAQRAYDLVEHVMTYVPITEYEFGIDNIPGLAEWPKPD